MALVHESAVFSVDQAAIYPMLTDVSGSAPTYGTKILFPGIKTVTPNFDWLAKELFGDNVVLGRAAKVRQLMLALTYARMNLDILAAITGGTVTDAGTTPNQTATFTLPKTATPGYFKIEFRILGLDVGFGSLNVKVNKAKVVDGSPVTAPEDFGIQTLNVAAVYPIGTTNLIDIVLNETAAALA